MYCTTAPNWNAEMLENAPKVVNTTTSNSDKLLKLQGKLYIVSAIAAVSLSSC